MELFILRCAIDLKPSHNKTKKRQAGDLAGKTVTKPLKDGIHLLRAAGRPPFFFSLFFSVDKNRKRKREGEMVRAINYRNRKCELIDLGNATIQCWPLT